MSIPRSFWAFRNALILDTPRGLALSSNENRARTQSAPSRESQKVLGPAKVIRPRRWIGISKTSTKPVHAPQAMRTSFCRNAHDCGRSFVLPRAGLVAQRRQRASLACSHECRHTLRWCMMIFRAWIRHFFRRGRPRAQSFRRLHCRTAETRY